MKKILTYPNKRLGSYLGATQGGCVKLEVNKNINCKVDIECRQCRRSTKHLILCAAEISDSEAMGPDNYYSWSSNYEIAQCQGCEQLTFRITSATSEDDYVQLGTDEWEQVKNIDIYPNPNEGRQPLADSIFLPNQVSRIYEETLKSLNNNQSVLCGIGVRALIETVCKDKSASGRDLNNKINDLVTQGVLTKEGAVIFHQLRTLGNDAAHEVKPHSDKRLEVDVPQRP